MSDEVVWAALESEIVNLKEILKQARSRSKDKSMMDVIETMTSQGGTLKLSNVRKMKLRTRCKLRGHASKVYSLYWSRDENSSSILLSTSHDSTLILWDTVKRLKLKAVDLDCAWTMSCALGSTEKANDICASAGMDELITIHSLADRSQSIDSGRLLRSLSGHGGFISSIDFCDHSRKLLSASADRTCRLWDLASGQQTGEFRGHTSEIYCMAQIPRQSNGEGSCFATGSADRSLKLWDDRVDGRLGSILTVPDLHLADINSVVFFPNGHAVATSSDDCSVRLVDLRASQCVQAYMAPAMLTPISTVGRCCETSELCQRGQRMSVPQHFPPSCSAAKLDRVQSQSISQLPSRSSSHQLKQTNSQQQAGSDRFVPITGVDFSSSGRLLFCGCDNFDCVVFDTLTAELVSWLHGHENRIQVICVNKTGEALATGSWDSTIRIWN